MKYSLVEALEGQPNLLVGVTYETWDHASYDQNEPTQRGWEMEYMPSTMSDVQMIAGTYGIQSNELKHKTHWTSEDTPSHDWMTGDETFYQLEIKHLDGSDLSAEERQAINDMLKG